jgi:hypothetical protein
MFFLSVFGKKFTKTKSPKSFLGYRWTYAISLVNAGAVFAGSRLVLSRGGVVVTMHFCLCAHNPCRYLYSLPQLHLNKEVVKASFFLCFLDETCIFQLLNLLHVKEQPGQWNFAAFLDVTSSFVMSYIEDRKYI